LFCFFFSGMGALFAVLPIGALYKQYRGFHPAMLPMPLFGLVFVAIGAGLYYVATRPIVFDLKRRVFCKGFRMSGESWTRQPGNSKGTFKIEMDKIRALQVLSEYCRGNKSSYYSYELNLVLDDATRVNVVDHGDLRALREDAATLGLLLSVPVWDVQAARADVLKKSPWPV
jgi:hypothetical protein